MPAHREQYQRFKPYETEPRDMSTLNVRWQREHLAGGAEAGNKPEEGEEGDEDSESGGDDGVSSSTWSTF